MRCWQIIKLSRKWKVNWFLYSNIYLCSLTYMDNEIQSELHNMKLTDILQKTCVTNQSICYMYIRYNYYCKCTVTCKQWCIFGSYYIRNYQYSGARQKKKCNVITPIEPTEWRRVAFNSFIISPEVPLPRLSHSHTAMYSTVGSYIFTIANVTLPPFLIIHAAFLMILN